LSRAINCVGCVSPRFTACACIACTLAAPLTPYHASQPRISLGITSFMPISFLEGKRDNVGLLSDSIPGIYRTFRNCWHAGYFSILRGSGQSLKIIHYGIWIRTHVISFCWHHFHVGQAALHPRSHCCQLINYFITQNIAFLAEFYNYLDLLLALFYCLPFPRADKRTFKFVDLNPFFLVDLMMASNRLFIWILFFLFFWWARSGVHFYFERLDFTPLSSSSGSTFQFP